MDKRIELSQKLITKDPSTLNMVIGFDGFVDEIIHVVDKRMDSEHFTRVDTISQLADRIQKASGLSTNIELVSTYKKIGGNGPIMCNALAINKPAMSYIGALGFPTIDDVFSVMEDAVDLYSIATNGHTDALEFDDGKLLLGKMSTLNDVTYERLLEEVGLDKLIQLLSEANLFASVNWSMLPNMTDIYKKLLEHVLPQLPASSTPRYMFIDLADPEKREDDEVQRLLSMLKEFSKYYVVVLGLNKKEAYDVAGVLELFDKTSLENMQISLEDLNQALYEFLEIGAVVIHPVDRSCCVVDGVFYEELGPYIAKPKLSTGAGDNFNAGFMLGMLLGVTPDEALLCGMSTSGFYVRNARSPRFDELIVFMNDWANNTI
ncbi:hypothetical protein [Candidatus Xianfuyuplasma coldseepsis]|uniref:Carbohydrate kinase PfkB domain-containing protein n=1 Tax=Candidatus Xianfuyuplasma coldseepsis TaxID=2782163 RepID=A0A7L7KRX6_9MOLU|nr:hypothetical protein [Xianfuyuplasma coldseepsis]QMS85483.1 hypothetical protein G4Z02_06920 [Xianfuyuplasma coldseepsis]